jgi:methylated-DNA-[protein]-cysteine S-methyltransferase
MTYVAKTMDSPVGALLLVASARGLEAVLFENGRNQRTYVPLEMAEKNPLLERAAAQLAEYFAGKRTMFDLKLAPSGTIFQLKAWKELQAIPYGETISYGEQARRMGDAKKARAVGMANGRNPLSIVVPCHRVVGASGGLTGFGGGLKTKEFLLELEKKAAMRHAA